MMNIVKILSTKINDGKRLAKFLRMGLNDVQENNVAQPHGIDANPVKDMTAIYAQTSVKGESVIIGYINQNQLADIGELRLFSTDNSNEVQAVIFMRNNGDIEINGDADNMVRFSELKAAYDELKGDLNALISAYNSHIHITTATIGATPTPGVIAPTTSTGTPSTATIDAAKIDNVKTN
jgi:hypothetical protein